MSVIIKGMKILKECKWMDEGREIHRCPLLDDFNDCNLQDCEPYWTWKDQMARCPLVEIPEGADLVDRNYLLSEYDRQHEGPPGEARKIIEEVPPLFEED